MNKMESSQLIEFIEALRIFDAALSTATNNGALDELGGDIHPDFINEVCDSVGRLIEQVMYEHK